MLIPLLQGPVLLGFTPLFLPRKMAHRPARARSAEQPEAVAGPLFGLDALGAAAC